ncbi:MAG: hypothetical protein CVV57_07450 [Tenericutes bacterium HGW-Tenericutes-2]|jgi:hypothetical protein|nr:MAG: hypothetical protein CVV57_07450 [Tenericutes bacterium HGW-Tenericutes-2]
MWWESLTSFQQIMFVIAVSSSAVMLIFLVLMLIGVDGSDFDGVDAPDLDVDFLNDEPLSGIGGLRILTLKGVLAFLSIGAWTAYLFVDVLGPIFSSLIGVVLGFVAAYLQALAYRAMMRLESSGNIDYNNAVGKTGTVYMRVPKLKSGKGKVTLVIQERYAEIDAVTEEEEDILPKTSIVVIGLLDPTTLIIKTNKGE